MRFFDIHMYQLGFSSKIKMPKLGSARAGKFQLELARAGKFQLELITTRYYMTY